MINQYSLFEKIQTVYYLLVTKIFYRKARLIRLPFYCRGKKQLFIEGGFTTGRNCRFDLQSNGVRKKTNYSLFFGKNCKIGDNVHIVATEKVVFGNDCLLASNIFISDTSHGTYKGEQHSSPDSKPDDRDLVTEPVTIGDRVWIGENVVVLPGITIGSGVIVGANSVINKSVADDTMVAGVPAKPIKKFNRQTSRWERIEID